MGGQRIDASLDYENLAGVAEGIRRSGVPRDRLFITAKVGFPITSAGSGEMGYYATGRQMSTTLALLKTSYVDLMMIHWPNSKKLDPQDPSCARNGRQCRLSTWRGLEREFRAGRARAIGVSNYEVEDVQELLEDSPDLLPSVNQYEFHPFWQQQELLRFCKAHGIAFNGYGQLGTPDQAQVCIQRSCGEGPIRQWSHALPDNAVVRGVAEETSRTTGEVLLRFSWQQGVLVNPRTLSDSHMREALVGMHEFALTGAQMDRLT